MVVAVGINGPTAEEVDTYLEAQLPEHLDVEDVKIEHFIDPTTKEGRVSVSAGLRFVEGVYRDATDQEILNYLANHGIAQSERQLYLPFNQYRSIDMEHRFLEVITGPGTTYPITTELLAKKTVEGWSFSGNGPSNGIGEEFLAGKPVQAFGSGALPMGNPQAEAYLKTATDKKGATNSQESVLLGNVQRLFTPGKTITIHMMWAHSEKRHDMQFTPEGAIALGNGGNSSFTVIGAIRHADPATAPFRTDQATKARINGQLEHRLGTLTPNYDLTMDFFYPKENRFVGQGQMNRASIFEKHILSQNELNHWNWWTD